MVTCPPQYPEAKLESVSGRHSFVHDALRGPRTANSVTDLPKIARLGGLADRKQLLSSSKSKVRSAKGYLAAFCDHNSVPLRLLCLNSRLSSFRNRQSVPRAIRLSGADLIIPTSCRRRVVEAHCALGANRPTWPGSSARACSREQHDSTALGPAQAYSTHMSRLDREALRNAKFACAPV